MKSLFKNTIAVFLTFCMAFSVFMPTFVFADETNENSTLNIPITVQERNGIEVKDYFFRRGIALKEGELYSVDNVCIEENGKAIVSAAESLQTYDDGSICWLLVSGVVNLRPNECKQLTVTCGKTTEKTIKYKQSHDEMRVTTPEIDMVFGATGIESIKYKGEEQLNGTPVNLYITIDGKTDYLTVSEISVLKSTNAYSKFKLKGRLNNTVCGEMYVTVAEGAKRIQIDHRITVEDNLWFESTGLTIGVSYKGAEAGTVVDSDYLNLGTMQFSTYDNTRFNGATNVAEMTGYDIGENSLNFAPIVNRKESRYYDGFSRTAHLYIGFYGAEEDWVTTLSYPPSVKVDGEQYVKAGQILTTYMNALTKECIETMKFCYAKSIGVLSAGVLPHEVNRDLDISGKISTMPGELEYNLGLCWMQSGDEEIYRLMFDEAEARADMCTYRGGRADLYGCLRGASTDDTYRLTIAHAYYGDEGGLYMAYCLTGDEWVEDSLRLAIKKNLEDMYQQPPTGFGENIFVYRSWSTGTSYPSGNVERYHESRGLIRVRTYYLLYQFTKDERWLDAMNDLLSWAKWAQKPNGAYPHFMYHNGDKYYDHTLYEEVFKDFVMLYGVRGVNQLLDFTDNADALEVTLNVADYLCDSRDEFGTILWYPCPDPKVYSLADGTSRGPSPFTTMMAIDIVCTAFEKTGDEKYLIAIADFLEAYLGMEFGGIGASSFGSAYCEPNVGRTKVADALRGTTVLRFSDDLGKIFLENKERLMELGYENVLLIFEEDATSAKDAKLLKYEFPDVVHNVYQTEDTKAVFASNLTAADWDGYREWDKNVQLEFDENKLWQGAKNIIKDSDSVIIEKFLKHPDYFSAIQRPVFVEQLTGEANANIVEYNAERVEIDFNGDYEISLKLKDGIFPVDDNEEYNVSVSYLEGTVKLTVTKGKGVKPQNGAIGIMFNNKGTELKVVGAEEIKNAGLGDVEVTAPLSAEQLEKFMKYNFDKDVNFESEQPTWEEFGKELIPSLAENAESILENAGIRTAFDVQNADVPDNVAVLYGANALNVEFEGDALSSDVYLAKESVFGTKVSWKCSREDIITPDGVLNRTNADCDSVTLTATVTKNAATAEKTFTIPLKAKTIPTANQGQGFADDTAFPLIPQKEEFEITFTGIPFVAGIDSTMCFTSSKVETRQNSDVPYIVRFNPSGYIDMYNTNTYTAGVLQYEVNKSYKFRVVINPKEEKYSAYVTPEGGEEIVIGENCGARQSAKIVDEIDKMWTWAGTDNCYLVKDVSLIKPDDEKTEPVGNGYYDENGLVFGKYRTNKNSIFPQVSENGLVINWVNSGFYLSNEGKYVQLYVGTESMQSQKLSLTEVLKNAGLVDDTITPESRVTAASLSRILVAFARNR